MSCIGAVETGPGARSRVVVNDQPPDGNGHVSPTHAKDGES